MPRLVSHTGYTVMCAYALEVGTQVIMGVGNSLSNRSALRFRKTSIFRRESTFSFRSPSFPALGFCMRGSLRKEWKGKAVQAHFKNKCISDLLPAPSVCFTDFAGNRTAAGKLFPCLEPGAVHQKLPSISGGHPMQYEENQKRVEKSVSGHEKCWIILESML